MLGYVRYAIPTLDQHAPGTKAIPLTAANANPWPLLPWGNRDPSAPAPSVGSIAGREFHPARSISPSHPPSPPPVYLLLRRSLHLPDIVSFFGNCSISEKYTQYFIEIYRNKSECARVLSRIRWNSSSRQGRLLRRDCRIRNPPLRELIPLAIASTASSPQSRASIRPHIR